MLKAFHDICESSVRGWKYHVESREDTQVGCGFSRFDCLFIEGHQPGDVLLSIVPTRGKLDKVSAQLGE